jgi:hypothetical protein
MGMTSANQRRFERFDLFERATLEWDSGDRTPVILIDVSLGGAQVLAKNEHEAGKSCKLVVGQKDDEIVLTGSVRYCKPGEFDLVAVGFKHHANTPEERIAIANLVNRIFFSPNEMPPKPTKLIEEWLEKAA